MVISNIIYYQCLNIFGYQKDLTKFGFAVITVTHVEIKVRHQYIHIVDVTGYQNCVSLTLLGLENLPANTWTSLVDYFFFLSIRSLSKNGNTRKNKIGYIRAGLIETEWRLEVGTHPT